MAEHVTLHSVALNVTLALPLLGVRTWPWLPAPVLWLFVTPVTAAFAHSGARHADC